MTHSINLQGEREDAFFVKTEQKRESSSPDCAVTEDTLRVTPPHRGVAGNAGVSSVHEGASPLLISLLWHPFLISPVGTSSREVASESALRVTAGWGHRDALKL